MPGMTDAHIHFFQSGGLYTRPDVIDLRSKVPYEKVKESFNCRKVGEAVLKNKVSPVVLYEVLD